ncbi:hypothetical protein [Spirosoma sp.]|uniref:hypothetical protein n=1 Tax=Spirosoma sp. TaxID=1899569 RepID=UPI00263935FF|nr:hypothetical protein [Spirosoma sp.]MCX6217577.1 hypothetical protein [Spirosoma sp.]
MSLKPTPGPWAQGQKDAFRRHFSVYAYSTRMGRPSRIIDCAPGFSHDFTDEEKEANARLCATAPELLQALQMLLKSYEQLINDAHEEIEHMNAVNIIKKATAL